MKKLRFILAVLISGLTLPLAGNCQSNVLASAEEIETVEESQRVLVIPFHPMRFYFSDCDRNLSKYSNVHIPDVRNTFRAGFDYASESKMEKKYETINLFQLKDSASLSFLDEFYDNVSYSMEAPSRAFTKKEKNFFKNIKSKMGGNSAKKESANSLNSEECYTEIEGEDNEYMRLNFKNPELLKKMNEAYQPDYYVTINQFEVKTDYEKCIDRELGKYRRRIKVHYNVFTPDGNLVHGDVVTAKYNSVSNDVNKIIQDNFGFLADYITTSIP